MASPPTRNDDSLTTPLMAADQRPPHLILTVDESADRSPTQVQNPRPVSSRNNPYAFVGAADGFEVPEASTIDPFRNHTPQIEGLYEWVKMLLCLPLAALRLVVFGACLAVGYLATRLALQGWKDKENPMPRWRSRLMWVTRFCARGILFSFGYHWIKRRGKPAPREIAPIVVSNHVSYIEPIFYFYEICPTIVASESHDSMPFVGTIIRAMQVIYVDRFSRSSRKHAVNEIKRKASSNRFPRVLLFPEGTTSNGRSLLSFQLGAFIPGYPIQPVVVRYRHVHFDQSWGNVSLGKLMFRMFMQFHNFMEVEYLPVIFPHENRKENAVHFAQRTSQAIGSALNVPKTSYSFGDFLLLSKAAEGEQENPSLYMVQMDWVQSLLHLSVMEALDFLDIFLSMNPDPSGCVEFYDFLRALRLKACGITEKMFDFINVSKTGKLNFKEFLIGSAHILKQPLFSKACEDAFSACDVNDKNHIEKQELQDAISLSIPNLNTNEMDGLFKLFDVDNDGIISKDDFKSCLRMHPLLIAIFAARIARTVSSNTSQHDHVEMS